MKITRTTYLVFVCGFSAMMLFSFSGIIYVINRHWKRIDHNLFDEEIYEYQYYVRRPGSTYVGSMMLPQEIKKDDFIFLKSGEDERVSYHLISNFGAEEYQCTGHCLCGEDKTPSSRRNAGVLTRGIYYLLVAGSSLLANELAGKFFKEQCEDSLKYECSEVAIQSEVEDCVRVFEPGELTGEDVDEEMIDESEASVYDYEDVRSYYCKGNCMTNVFMDIDAQEKADDFDCDLMELKFEVTVRDSDCLKDMVCNSPNLSARKKFMIELRNFCREESSFYTDDYWTSSEHREHSYYSFMQYCVAVSKGNVNSSIVCRQFAKDRLPKLKKG